MKRNRGYRHVWIIAISSGLFAIVLTVVICLSRYWVNQPLNGIKNEGPGTVKIPLAIPMLKHFPFPGFYFAD